MASDLEIKFQNYMLERFPDTEFDQEQIDEFWDFWLSGYQMGAEDHY